MIWKMIPQFDEYEVSEYGDVRRGDRLLKPEKIQGSGRKRFALTKNGRVYRYHAGHLVAFAFIGPKPSPFVELCHNDGFEHNNHFSNLRWDTKLANAADAATHRLNRKAQSALPVSLKYRLAVEAKQFVAAHKGVA